MTQLCIWFQTLLLVLRVSPGKFSVHYLFKRLPYCTFWSHSKYISIWSHHLWCLTFCNREFWNHILWHWSCQGKFIDLTIPFNISRHVELSLGQGRLVNVSCFNLAQLSGLSIFHYMDGWDQLSLESFNLFCGISEGEHNSDQNWIHLSTLPPVKFWWCSHTEIINCYYSIYCLRSSQHPHLWAVFCIFLHCRFWPQWDSGYSSM